MKQGTFLRLAVRCAIIAALWCLLPCVAAAQARIASPVVVETTPTLRARNVDPKLDHLTVRFDQPMSTSGWSWCGSGAAYPELTGRPFFADPYTAVLPVRLEPQKTYYLMINCPSGQNFRSPAGIPAESLPLRFTTGSGGAFIAAHTKNHAAWKELLSILRTRYSHLERTGTDWEAAFADTMPWVMESPTVDEWVARVGVMLEAADDPHLYLRTPDGTRVSTHATRHYYNGNRDAIARAFPKLEAAGPLARYGRDGDIAYLAIDGWDNTDQMMEPIQGAFDALADARVLILDMRANGGGDESEASRVAARFLDAGGVYERHRWRDPDEPGGWSAVQDRVITPAPGDKRLKMRVIVLQGPVCLSSNESFLEMMRLCPRAVFVGAPTGGSSANPKGFELPNGATIIVPRWQPLRPDGSPIEGIGLRPDIAIDGDFRTGDPVLKEALRLARGEME